MNRTAIWAIIILMSAAVVGVVWLQMDLIRMSIRVNEERFDKNVNYVLNEVAKRLETEEQREIFYSLNLNGFITRYVQREKQLAGTGGKETPSGSGETPTTVALQQTQVLDELMRDPTLLALYGLNLEKRPLEERIKPRFLDITLRQEFQNRSMDPQTHKYQLHYGIYSYEKKAFVIIDGHYLVDQPSGQEVFSGSQERNLYNASHRVVVFPHESPAPGELRLFFPNRTNIIWSSLWQNFIGSLFFTAIILFCFSYTLYVIVRQKQLSEMKNDFINNMTHEFKTPIATISLASDSITNPAILTNPEKVKRFANIIKQENNRMNSQVEKVLQMALIDKQDFSLKLTEVNLHDIISVAVENINLQVEKKEGNAKAVLEAVNPVVEGDITHVSNIINNLLDNANKYSPERPDITVYTRNVSNGIEVVVQDKGIGMGKAALKHIFDKFYRVSTGNLHDVKGFGLGLSYVKAMMTAHKGHIEVKSELGKGSSFTLFFPFRVEP